MVTRNTPQSVSVGCAVIFPEALATSPPSQMSGPQFCANVLSSPPCTDIKAGSGLMDTLLPTTISSIANLSSCMKDGKNEEGCKCACSAVNVTEPLCYARTAAVKQSNVFVLRDWAGQTRLRDDQTPGLAANPAAVPPENTQHSNPSRHHCCPQKPTSPPWQ